VKLEVVRDGVVVIAAIAALTALLFRASDCNRELDRQNHMRNLECIKQGVYCGKAY
jgi:hypothetical protein